MGFFDSFSEKMTEKASDYVERKTYSAAEDLERKSEEWASKYTYNDYGHNSYSNNNDDELGDNYEYVQASGDIESPNSGLQYGAIIRLSDGSYWYQSDYKSAYISYGTEGKVIRGDYGQYILKADGEEYSVERIDNINEAYIDGDFEGWDGSKTYRLDNGEVWKQSDYTYSYSYSYRPRVIILSHSWNHYMSVDNTDFVKVERKYASDMDDDEDATEEEVSSSHRNNDSRGSYGYNGNSAWTAAGTSAYTTQNYEKHSRNANNSNSNQNKTQQYSGDQLNPKKKSTKKSFYSDYDNKYFIGKPSQVAVNYFYNNGFSNIETIPIYRLNKKNIHLLNSIVRVIVGRKKSFEYNTKFHYKDKVLVYYYERAKIRIGIDNNYPLARYTPERLIIFFQRRGFERIRKDESIRYSGDQKDIISQVDYIDIDGSKEFKKRDAIMPDRDVKDKIKM